jgi:ribosome-associated translation inhibitor RaiA
MSDITNSPPRIPLEQLRLGAGFASKERDHVLEILSPLDRHLAHWHAEQVDLEVSVKDRGGPEQKVTLETWLPHWPSVVATAVGRELDHALIEARKELIRQIEDKKSKHEMGTGRRGPA